MPCAFTPGGARLTRIARFSESGRARAGVVVGEEVADAGDLDLLVASPQERARDRRRRARAFRSTR